MAWIAFSLSVFVVARILPGVRMQGLGTAIMVAAVYGVLKFCFYWLLVFLSLPFIIATLGLFLIVITPFCSGSPTNSSRTLRLTAVLRRSWPR